MNESEIKKFLRKTIERYRELYFQNCAFRAVLLARAQSDPSLLKLYREALKDEVAQETVRRRFETIVHKVDALTQDQDIHEITVQIPEVPKVE